MSANGTQPTRAPGQPARLAELLPSQESIGGFLKSIGCGSVSLTMVDPEIPHPPRIRTEIDRRFDLIAPEVKAAIDERAAFPWFIHGKAGGGKTCGALCFCDKVAGTCLYREFSDLCADVAACKGGVFETVGSHDSAKMTPSEYWRNWMYADCCVLDDIGLRETASDHQYECLKTAIDRRHSRALIIVSNHDLDMLARIYDDRIASRCAAGTVIEVRGKDRRVQR